MKKKVKQNNLNLVSKSAVAVVTDNGPEVGSTEYNCTTVLFYVLYPVL